ncbi:hypothetical protein V4W88_02690 [Pediococcus acidilactici]|uniref:hypothetical protein n=1 Tax=Pediococcus acidilactici TaxID=1254 RepID=UPI002FBF131F
MHIDILKFDQFRGHQVEKIRLINDHDVSVGVLTMGAILNEFSAPKLMAEKISYLVLTKLKSITITPFTLEWQSVEPRDALRTEPCR